MQRFKIVDAVPHQGRRMFLPFGKRYVEQVITSVLGIRKYGDRDDLSGSLHSNQLDIPQIQQERHGAFFEEIIRLGVLPAKELQVIIKEKFLNYPCCYGEVFCDGFEILGKLFLGCVLHI